MKLVCVGGHLSPLLAVLDALPKDAEPLVIGRKYSFEGDKALSLEYQELQARGIRFEPITTGRLQRKFTKYTIPSLLKIPVGFFQSFIILFTFKPDVILCFGGYVSFPVAAAAFILQIPIVIHEQTTEAGATNKVLRYFAKKICISWSTSERFFSKKKMVLTGNPLRQFKIQNVMFKIDNKENVPVLYFTGGSAGSHAINTLVKGCLEKLLKDFYIIHQTGDSKEFKDFDILQQLRHTFDEKLKKRYMLTKFINPSEVDSVIAKADLVVGRSGANTVTELIYFGKPAFLIPYPYSQDNEQEKNAKMFKDIGLGEIGVQFELTSEKLYAHIINMIKNIDIYKKSGNKARKLVKSDAAQHIIAVLKSLSK